MEKDISSSLQIALMSNPKISALIFSRDAPDTTIDLAKDIYEIVDEIVIVDCSVKVKYKILHEKFEGLKKVKLFHTMALGYADPMRAFGLEKCTKEWILYIDTDERLSADLKRDLRSIISNGHAAAYQLKRYENCSKSSNLDEFFTWQTRIYQKDRVKYLGITHEQPIIHGITQRVYDNGAFLLHVNELRQRFGNEYSKMDIFERFSYENYKARMLDYLSKVISPGKIAKNTTLGRMVRVMIFASQHLAFRKSDEEISYVDYLFLSMVRNAAYGIISKKINPIGIISGAMGNANRIAQLRQDDEDNTYFDIAQKINSIGVIKYLMLDDIKVVDALSRKYEWEQGGIDLLLRLLLERHNGKYP